MRILITGYYGAGNFGDDIMLEAFCKQLKEHNSQVRIDILKLFPKDINITLDKNIKIIDFTKVRGKSILFPLLLLKYDQFLWVGGTCFTDEDGDGLYEYMSIVHKMKKKFGYIGVGIGSLTKSDRIEKTEFLIKNCNFISLRDEKSYQYVKSIVPQKSNVYLTEDLAYLFVDKLNILGKESENRDTVKIIISWRNLINYKTIDEENILMDNLIKSIQKLCSQDFKKDILILPLDDRRDNEKNTYIFQQLIKYRSENTQIQYQENLSPLDKVKLLSDCDINISGRLHGIFVSELCNKKTIALSYSVKIDEFLKSINKYDDCIHIADLTEANFFEKLNVKHKNISQKLIEERVNLSKKNIITFNEYLLNNK